MDSTNSDVAIDFPPIFKIYKDNRIERFVGEKIAPPSLDPLTSVQSKDVVISLETGVAARLYIPKGTKQTQKKFPLLVYIHGGGFFYVTVLCDEYHRYLNHFVGEANVVAVSIEYRKAPKHPLPIAYHDSWDVLKWVASHVDGMGPDEWLKGHADFDRVFFAGDSAEANIAHHMALKVGTKGLAGVKLEGVVLVHPYFLGKEPIGGEKARTESKETLGRLWRYTFPATSGSDDPYIIPASDPKLGSLGCWKVLVCVAEKDFLRDRGQHYRKLLEKSGWGGVVDVTEAPREDHAFHIVNPGSENSVAMLKRIVSFIHEKEL